MHKTPKGESCHLTTADRRSDTVFNPPNNPDGIPLVSFPAWAVLALGLRDSYKWVLLCFYSSLHHRISSRRVYFRLPPQRWWWRCWKWTPRWEWASAAGLPEPWMEISQHNGQSICHELNRLADFPLAAAPDIRGLRCGSTRSMGPLLKSHGWAAVRRFLCRWFRFDMSWMMFWCFSLSHSHSLPHVAAFSSHSLWCCLCCGRIGVFWMNLVSERFTSIIFG